VDTGVSPEKLHRIQQLFHAGQNAAVVAEFGEIPTRDLETSPTLALLLGTAQSRLGHLALGRGWVAAALEGARVRGDVALEARSLNASGAIAFLEGRIEDAAGFLAEGLAVAERRGDQATVGRCSNNLGIIANLRGQHARAIGAYTIARAAFQQAGQRGGVAETFHNLAITYRDQRAFGRAWDAEERAAREASAAGDLSLVGLVQCGCGEILLRRGEVELGRQEIQRALELHRDLGDAAGEAEDLRALAEALELLRQPVQAEAMLRDVVLRAKQIARPLLVAQGERDLARLLQRQKRGSEAASVARRARAGFASLGAVLEVGRIEGLLREIAP
jgi:tetratricopeptide (TPR) repeat protein